MFGFAQDSCAYVQFSLTEKRIKTKGYCLILLFINYLDNIIKLHNNTDKKGTINKQSAKVSSSTFNAIFCRQYFLNSVLNDFNLYFRSLNIANDTLFQCFLSLKFSFVQTDLLIKNKITAETQNTYKKRNLWENSLTLFCAICV